MAHCHASLMQDSWTIPIVYVPSYSAFIWDTSSQTLQLSILCSKVCEKIIRQSGTILPWFRTPLQPPCTSIEAEPRSNMWPNMYQRMWVWKERKECGYVLFRVFSMFRKKTTEELIKLMIKAPLPSTPMKSNNRRKSIALQVLDYNFTVI